MKNDGARCIERSVARPAGIAVGGAQLIFHVAELLFQVCNLFFLGVDFRCALVYILAGILLLHCLGGVGVILDAAFALFALEHVEFLLGSSNFRPQSRKTLPPDFLGIGLRGFRIVTRIGL